MTVALGRGAQVAIEIIADVSDAVSGLDDASGAVKEYGDKASEASTKSSKVGEGIDKTGESAGRATQGFRDLGGAMQAMGGTVGDVGTIMVNGATAFEAIDGAATLYAVATDVATVATQGFSKAMNFLKVSILSNPIFWIAAIIIAIVVAFVLLYQHCEAFRKVVDSVFKFVLGIIKSVWSWIKSNWPLLLAILAGPIGLAVLAIAKNWDAIKRGAATVIDWVKSVWNGLTSLLSAPFNAAWDAIQNVIQWIKDAIQSVLDLIGRIHIPDLSALNPFKSAPTVAGLAVSPSATAATGSGGGIVVNVTGALDAEGVARQIRRILSSSDVRGGRVGVLRPIGTV